MTIDLDQETLRLIEREVQAGHFRGVDGDEFFAELEREAQEARRQQGW